MENNQKKTIEVDGGDDPKTLWTIDRKKCTVCGECVDACLLGLLDIKDDQIVLSSQYSCKWCGDCANACASDAIVLT